MSVARMAWGTSGNEFNAHAAAARLISLSTALASNGMAVDVLSSGRESKRMTTLPSEDAEHAS
jgi:hypothetical protein